MRSTRRATLAAGLFALALCGTGTRADDLTTTAGKKITGKLVAVTAEGVVFSTGDAKVTVPGRDIVLVDLGGKVEPPPAGATYSEIELTDGSSFRVAKFAIKGKKFETEVLAGPKGVPEPTVELPMGAVFSAMRKAEDAKGRAEWKKLLAGRGKRDLYVIRQAEGLTYIEGTVLEGLDDGKRVKFEKEGGGTDELLQSRSAGFVFNQPQPASVPPTVCRVQDVFGNSLNAAKVDVTPSGVTVTTVSGASVKYASAAGIARLDYAQGNVAYLSDLDPLVDTPELPPEEMRLNPTAAVLKDKSLSNEPIKLDNVLYPKGLCLAPDTAVTFNLDGGYTQFKATVGVDENGFNATSAAKVTVEADGQVLFTGTVTRKDKPKGLVLAVKGVKQLRVIVEADTPVNGNYVILADARVQK
jgi:hypothetical protein